MAKYCTSCGAKVEEGANFCTSCGASLNQTTAQKPQEANVSGNIANYQPLNPPGTEFVDILLKSTGEETKVVTEAYFTQFGFRIEWTNEYGGIAKKGSKAANFAIGTIAQYYEVLFQIFQTPNCMVVRLIRANAGALGGVVGVVRVSAKFKDLSYSIANYFHQKGLYLGQYPPPQQ